MAHGKTAGISRKVYLDYQKGTAQLTYSLTEGPPRPPANPPPPYGPECAEYIGVLNWLDLDDSVAEPIVENLVQVRSPFYCLSEDLITADAERLKASGLFQSVDYSIDAKQGSRQVSLRIRGKPLRIQRVRIKAHGLLTLEEWEGNPIPPLKAGDVYSRTRSIETREYLKGFYADPAWKIDVFETVEPTADQELEVCYHVLAYPRDEVYVNGKKFVILPHTPAMPE